MQHLLVYTGSQTASVTDTQIAALADPYVTNQNSHFILPQQMKLLYTFGMGTNLLAYRLNSPYFRRMFLPYFYPFVQGSAVVDNPSICDLRRNPLTLPNLEEIECDTSNGTGANQHTVGLFISDSDISQPVGTEVYTIRCTASIATAPNVFTSGNLTFGQTLPNGTYGVVGMWAQSTTGVFARLIIPAQAARPGCVAVPDLGKRPPFLGVKAPTGIMGQFLSTALPQIEFLTTGSDTAGQTVFLDLVKL